MTPPIYLFIFIKVSETKLSYWKHCEFVLPSLAGYSTYIYLVRSVTMLLRKQNLKDNNIDGVEDLLYICIFVLVNVYLSF